MRVAGLRPRHRKGKGKGKGKGKYLRCKSLLAMSQAFLDAASHAWPEMRPTKKADETK